jgi:hypothetical protein
MRKIALLVALAGLGTLADGAVPAARFDGDRCGASPAIQRLPQRGDGGFRLPSRQGGGDTSNGGT